MKKYIVLMRPHHFLKNGLIFLPLIFSRRLFEYDLIIKVVIGFIAFSFMASVIYIINDIHDVENDRKHLTKRFRPIAANQISVKNAYIFALLLSFISISLQLIFIHNYLSLLILSLYSIINLGYSRYGLKNIPLLDIVLLVSGFFLRVLYGSVTTNIVISSWLYLTIVTIAFYLGLGKRRNELKYNKDRDNGSRKVLLYYNEQFLDKNMYMCLSLALVFYSLWCVDPSTISRLSNNAAIWTVPLVLVISMKYSLDIEGSSDGDPIEVIIHDKVLILLGLLYAIIMFLIIYILN